MDEDKVNLDSWFDESRKEGSPVILDYHNHVLNKNPNRFIKPSPGKGCLACMIAAVASWFAFTLHPRPDNDFTILVWWYFCIAAFASVVYGIIAIGEGEGLKNVVYAFFILVVACAFSWGRYSCPHASYFTFGPYVWVVSGIECGNSHPPSPWWLGR